jgi:hypothetical protein
LRARRHGSGREGSGLKGELRCEVRQHEGGIYDLALSRDGEMWTDEREPAGPFAQRDVDFVVGDAVRELSQQRVRCEHFDLPDGVADDEVDVSLRERTGRFALVSADSMGALKVRT